MLAERLLAGLEDEETRMLRLNADGFRAALPRAVWRSTTISVPSR
jgi:hypothetical protein